MNDIEEIYLLHLWYPDFPTLFKKKESRDNYFEVELNASLLEISFKGIDLYIKADALYCLPNYFLPFEIIHFVKN